MLLLGSPESCFRVNAGHRALAAGEGVEVKRSRSGAGLEQAGSRAAATAVARRAEAQPEEPPPPGPRGECSPVAAPPGPEARGCSTCGGRRPSLGLWEDRALMRGRRLGSRSKDALSLLEAWGYASCSLGGKLSFESLNQENDEDNWTCQVLGMRPHL